MANHLLNSAAKRPEILLFNPPADSRIEAGDALVVMGENANLLGLEKNLETGA